MHANGGIGGPGFSICVPDQAVNETDSPSTGFILAVSYEYLAKSPRAFRKYQLRDFDPRAAQSRETQGVPSRTYGLKICRKLIGAAKKL